MASPKESKPEDFIDLALGLPILQPFTPAWGRQPGSAPTGPNRLPRLAFPKWADHPSSGLLRPAWNRPNASAPAATRFRQPVVPHPEVAHPEVAHPAPAVRRPPIRSGIPPRPVDQEPKPTEDAT